MKAQIKKKCMHSLRQNSCLLLGPQDQLSFGSGEKHMGSFFSLSIFTCTALQVKKYPTVVFCGEMQMVTGTPIITFVYSGLRKASNSI